MLNELTENELDNVINSTKFRLKELEEAKSKLKITKQLENVYSLLVKNPVELHLPGHGYILGYELNKRTDGSIIAIPDIYCKNELFIELFQRRHFTYL